MDAMTRAIPTSLSTAIDSAHILPFFAVDMSFASGPVRLWTGTGQLQVGDNDNEVYTGAGTLLNVSDIHETADTTATGAKVLLSGVSTELLALSLKETYQGRRSTIYFGILEVSESYLQKQDDGYVLQESAGKIIIGAEDTMINVFSGYLDQMNIEDGVNTSTISISIESKLIDLERKRIARYTSEYHKSLYPDDLGFDFVEPLQDMRFTWGRE